VKKLLVPIIVLTLLLVTAGTALAAGSGPLGPNPDAGDCDPDGSSLDSPNGPNGAISGSGPVGPAPNSGDGIPDGSGFLP
jgi:hypothetical protein